MDTSTEAARRPTGGPGLLARTFLVGGGWDAAALDQTLGRFVAAAGPAPAIACLLLVRPGHEQYFSRFADRLAAVGAATAVPVFIGRDRPLDLARLDGADGVLVGGGSPAGYLDAMAEVRAEFAGWLAARAIPYAGFSAGAAIAARAALIGGWRMRGRLGLTAVCPEEAADELDEVEVVEGLGVAPFTIDVHAGAWGTVSRLVSLVHAGHLTEGWAIDEGTMLVVGGAGAVSIHGTGRAYLIRAAGPDVTVTIRCADPPGRPGG